MNAAGITNRIFTFVRRCIGFIPGGLAYSNDAASVVFAGMNGSTVAVAAALGKMEVKAMRENGYTTDFAAAVTAASSVIGSLQSGRAHVRTPVTYAHLLCRLLLE